MIKRKGSHIVRTLPTAFDTRIIIEATPNEFPWVVRLTDKINDGNFRSCVGAIFNENWVITDYSCGRELTSTITVYAGDHDVLVTEPTEQIRKAVRTIRSPTVERGGEFELIIKGQISLIQLDTPLEFNEFVQPIVLATPSSYYTSGNVTKVLWRETASSSVLIKNTDHSLLSDGTCMEYFDQTEFPFYWNFDPETLICSGLFDISDDRCENILGEPMVCQSEEGEVLCGIGHSDSYHCQKQRQFPSTLAATFSEIASFQPWIVNRTTLQPESSANWANQDTGCGGALNGSAGYLSYKLDETLQPNERCTWIIRAEDFSSIRIHLLQPTSGLNNVLTVSDFNGEEPGDLNPTDLSTTGADYTVRGPVVFITLSTGADSPGQGFALEFYGSGLDQALGYLATDVHLNSTGISYHYPSNDTYYPSWSSGCFVVNPEGELYVDMTFTELYVSGVRDFVYVYQWNQSQFLLIDKIEEGIELPKIYGTEEGLFVLLFVSDDSVAGRGFTVTI